MHGGEHPAAAGEQEAVRGLAVASDGMALKLARTEAPRGREFPLRFTIVGNDGRPVRDFEVEHERRLHLIVARRDGTGFQHLHPTLGKDGAWTAPVTLREAGSYRVFADFKRDGRNQTLGADLAVDGNVDWRPLPAPASRTSAGDGYSVALDAGGPRAGRASLRWRGTEDRARRRVGALRVRLDAGAARGRWHRSARAGAAGHARAPGTADRPARPRLTRAFKRRAPAADRARGGNACTTCW
jgi:hypothetical protein